MRSVLLIGLLVLAACARANTTMVSSDTAVISGRGSAFDSPAAVVKATLREAAQQTTQRGYRYFAVLGTQNMSSTGAIYTPGQTTTTTTGSATGYSYGRTTQVQGTAYSTTRTTPGYVTPIFKPGVDATIKMFRERPAINAEIWDAQDILSMKE